MSALSDLAGYVADRLPAVEGRVYPLVGKQGETRPTITYQEDSATPFYQLDGEAGYTELQATYTAWSLDYAQCEDLIDELRLALTGVIDKTIGDTVIDCILVEPSEADTSELIEGTDQFVYSKSCAFFIRYYRTAALAPGV